MKQTKTYTVTNASLKDTHRALLSTQQRQLAGDTLDALESELLLRPLRFLRRYVGKDRAISINEFAVRSHIGYDTVRGYVGRATRLTKSSRRRVALGLALFWDVLESECPRGRNLAQDFKDAFFEDAELALRLMADARRRGEDVGERLSLCLRYLYEESDRGGNLASVHQAGHGKQ